MDLPMVREAVAAGEGALQTLMILELLSIRKSSTKAPEGETAWARIPAGADLMCSPLISGMSFCRALTNAPLL